MKKILPYLFIMFCIIACEPQNIGPCVHIYEEPILTIESISGGVDGNEISQAYIYNIKIDSAKRDPVLITGEASKNISVEDSVIVCSVPCGFGTEDGEYQFSVTADGYPDTTITSNAKYGKSKGGCPSSSSEGIKISFSLGS
jgi:hypothetical protein